MESQLNKQNRQEGTKNLSVTQKTSPEPNENQVTSTVFLQQCMEIRGAKKP